eukprot:6078223-Amphidinium_carterae.2
MSEFENRGPSLVSSSLARWRDSLLSSLSFASHPCRTQRSVATFGELPFRLPNSVLSSAVHHIGLLLPSICASRPRAPRACDDDQTPLLYRPFRLGTLNIRSLNESGKIKFVAKRAADLQLDVLFLQETRLPSSLGDLQVEGYECITSPALAASGAHGGLALLVKLDPLLAVLSHRSVSHR